MITDNRYYAYYSGCEVLDKNNPFETKISMKKGEQINRASQDFNNNYSYSILK